MISTFEEFHALREERDTIIKGMCNDSITIKQLEGLKVAKAALEKDMSAFSCGVGHELRKFIVANPDLYTKQTVMWAGNRFTFFAQTLYSRVRHDGAIVIRMGHDCGEYTEEFGHGCLVIPKDYWDDIEAYKKRREGIMFTRNYGSLNKQLHIINDRMRALEVEKRDILNKISKMELA